MQGTVMTRLGIAGAFALGFALAWTLRARPEARAPEQDSEPARPSEARSWEAVQAALARIEERLDLSSLEASSRDPAPQASTGVDDEQVREIQAALVELRAELERRDGPSGSPGIARDLLALKEQAPTPKWDALKELIQAWNRDEQAATQSVLMLGYRDVLERFGTPTDSWSNERGLSWLYADGVDPLTGENLVEVWLLFRDGFVVQLGIKQP